MPTKAAAALAGVSVLIVPIVLVVGTGAPPASPKTTGGACSALALLAGSAAVVTPVIVRPLVVAPIVAPVPTNALAQQPPPLAALPPSAAQPSGTQPAASPSGSQPGGSPQSNLGQNGAPGSGNNNQNRNANPNARASQTPARTPSASDASQRRAPATDTDAAVRAKAESEAEKKVAAKKADPTKKNPDAEVVKGDPAPASSATRTAAKPASECTVAPVASSDSLPLPTAHTVARGETLSAIASATHVKLADLEKANPQLATRPLPPGYHSPWDYIRTGEQIAIPHQKRWGLNEALDEVGQQGGPPPKAAAH